MADNGSTPVPAPAPAPAPAGAVVAEPALAPLRKVPPKVTSPMDRLKAYLKEIPGIRSRLVKVIDEQEESLKKSRASIEAFDQTTARITALVKSWEEQNAGHDAHRPAPVEGSIPTPSAAPVVSPVARVSILTTGEQPAGEKSGG